MEHGLTEAQIDARLDAAILKADPAKLSEEELDRRLELAQKKSFGQQTLEAAGDVAGMISTAADYPIGIARSAVTNVADVLADKKTPGEGWDDFTESFAGPSHAPSFEDMARRGGVSEKPMQAGNFKPFGDIPQTAIVGTAADLAAGYGATKAMGAVTGAMSRGARSVLSADDQALKAVGAKSKEMRKAIEAAPNEDPTKYLGDLSKYAQDNVITGLSGPEKMLRTARMKMEDVGTRLGALRQKAEQVVQENLLKNRTKTNFLGEDLNRSLNDYKMGTFDPRLAKERIFSRIDRDYVNPKTSSEIKNFVSAELDPLIEMYSGRASNLMPEMPPAQVPKQLDIGKVGKLKSDWAEKVKFGTESTDFPPRRDAYRYLQQDADGAIQNEISFSDKILKGQDLAEHNKLKDEYTKLNVLTEGLKGKVAGDIARNETITAQINPMNSTRIQTGIAKLPTSSPMGPKSTGAATAVLGYGDLANMRSGNYKEPTIGGFPLSQTIPVGPHQYLDIKKSIDQDSLMSATEKAKRLNLLNKFGRIYGN